MRWFSLTLLLPVDRVHAPEGSPSGTARDTNYPVKGALSFWEQGEKRHRVILGAYGRTLSARVNLGITESRLEARVPSTLTEFGHVIDSFGINEVLKQAGWAQASVSFTHFRTKDGREVDLVCETDDGRTAAVEIKAASMVEDKDFRGLRLLRDTLRSEFVGGVVLYLGSRSYTREDRLHVLPLDWVWS